MSPKLSTDEIIDLKILLLEDPHHRECFSDAWVMEHLQGVDWDSMTREEQMYYADRQAVQVAVILSDVITLPGDKWNQIPAEDFFAHISLQTALRKSRQIPQEIADLLASLGRWPEEWQE